MTETKSAVYGLYIEIPRDNEEKESYENEIEDILKENGYDVHSVIRLDEKKIS